MENLPALLADKPATERIELLRACGLCYQCYDLETNGGVFGQQPSVYDDPHIRVALESRPRMAGHTIVIYKPHHDDLSSLTDAEAGYNSRSVRTAYGRSNTRWARKKCT